jgi:peptidoglycan/LPS O-acetylase OafA/YrhL
VKYRAEIDGLRAISVLSVLLFHLGDKSASGGFVGVDVFFVISGYLITTFIYTDVRAERFSLTSFYVRRIKRIAPALLTLIVVVIVAGYLILAPGDYDVLARSSLFALAGASNFFFLNHTGYFDTAAEMMPMLHTWSLGVEEQFYVVWPSLFVVLWKLAEKTKISMFTLIVALITVSFVTYLVINTTDPRVAFYMPYTRAWELALGGIVPFIPEIAGGRFSRFKRILPWTGFILISAAILQFRSSVDLTGNKVVASVVGAFLVIYAIQPTSLLYRFLASRPLVFIGKISYSTYLYHLPIIVLWKHYAGASKIPSGHQLLFIVSTIALSWLSWRYIEQPCRRVRWDGRVVFPTFGMSELAIACVCAIIVFSDGAAARIPASILPMRSLEAMWDWSCPGTPTSPRCSGAPSDSASARAVIWGDSNAVHFMPMLDVAARRENVSIRLLGSCPPVIATGYALRHNANSPSYMASCDSLHGPVMDALKSKDIDMVILAAAWAGVTFSLYNSPGDRLSEDTGLSVLKSALSKLLPEIAAEGRTVVIVSQIPNWDETPVPCVVALETSLLRSSSFRSSCHDAINNYDRKYYNSNQARTDGVLRSFDGRNGVVFWPTVDYLCPERRCTTTVDGEFIYRDEGHLRRNLREQTNIDLADLLRFGKLMELAKRVSSGRLAKPNTH